jgi:hypothetical protein
MSGLVNSFSFQAPYPQQAHMLLIIMLQNGRSYYGEAQVRSIIRGVNKIVTEEHKPQVGRGFSVVRCSIATAAVKTERWSRSAVREQFSSS